MSRDYEGRHEAGPVPISTDHGTVQQRARTSVLTHPGYKPRHRKQVNP